MEQNIRICDVEKYYGQKSSITKAVNRVSFEVHNGEFVGIMGSSGSGKSTLLNMISTIDRVTSGHIFYGDTDITELDEDSLSEFRKNNLGFVFQEFNLIDTLSVRENVELALTLHKKDKKTIISRTDELLSLLGIAEISDKFPHQISGGQKQRCACARALANNPSLILADEPTGALDSHSSRVLMETFEKMNTELKSTVLMVTHDAFSASYCKRILFLKDGQIFNELLRGEMTRKEFLNRILDVLAMTGGDTDVN